MYISFGMFQSPLTTRHPFIKGVTSKVCSIGSAVEKEKGVRNHECEHSTRFVICDCAASDLKDYTSIVGYNVKTNRFFSSLPCTFTLNCTRFLSPQQQQQTSEPQRIQSSLHVVNPTSFRKVKYTLHHTFCCWLLRENADRVFFKFLVSYQQ